MRILHHGPEHCLGPLPISPNDQIDGSSISRTEYLHWFLTECCEIFNIDNGHNYLGLKPPKFAIYEISISVI